MAKSHFGNLFNLISPWFKARLPARKFSGQLEKLCYTARVPSS
jgi:hypothetical protein